MKSLFFLFALASLPAVAIQESNRVQAATATATDNPLCKLITPFYWEIGDQSTTLASDSVGFREEGSAILNTTRLPVASASKMIYGTYVVQLRGSADALTNEDISFLHFTSGYTNIINSSSLACPTTLNPFTVDECLTLKNADGVSYSAQTAADVGIFDYDGGHMENHASRFTGLGGVVAGSLGAKVQSVLGTPTNIEYSEPLMSGGVTSDAQDFAIILQHIVSGALAMHDALGIDPVCTKKTKTCVSVGSPIPENWHYSIGHWVEDDPDSNGDGAFSSPGEYGFYPWVEAGKHYYGLIARSNSSGWRGISQQGYASAQCGRLIRHAWDTGQQQTGNIPD